MSNLLTRIAVALVGIPVALGLVWYGGLPLALLVMLAAVLGTRELFALAEPSGVRPLRGLGMTLAALAPFTTWLLAGDRQILNLEFLPLFLLVQWPLADR